MTLKELFTAIANAIRGKKDSTAKIKASNFPQEIETIITKGEPYVFTTEVQMDTFLGSTKAKDGDIVLYTGTTGTKYVNSKYYQIVKPVGTDGEYSIISTYLQEKTITPTKANQIVEASGGYNGLSKVNVNAIPSDYIIPEGNITINQNGTYSVNDKANAIVNVPSGSCELNIAFGDTAPEDTSKLWVKTSEPSNVLVSTSQFGNGSLETGISYLPTGAYGIASGVVGTKIYLFGGNSSNGRLNKINVFDTTTNTITTLSTTLPTSANGIASGVVGTKIYLFGGYSGKSELNTINVFDTTTNTITTLSTTLPIGANGIASGVVGTKIYLFGGSSSNGELNKINVFDTTTNTITTLSTTLPIGANGISSGVVGTKIYLFGGYPDNSLSKTINVFDTTTNTITTLSTTLPTRAYDIATGVVGTKIYLFGGFSENYHTNTINVFDTTTNTITTLSTTLPTSAYGIASGVVGTKIYLFGGNSSNGRLNTINCYIISLPLTSNNLLLQQSLTDNLFNLINNESIILSTGVKAVYKGNSNNEGELVEALLYKNNVWTNI